MTSVELEPTQQQIQQALERYEKGGVGGDPVTDAELDMLGQRSSTTTEEDKESLMLSPGAKINLMTIIQAAKADHLALMECRDKITGEIVAVVCAVNEVDGEFEMVPMARLFDRNPYEVLEPPAAASETH
jgi:hypothetical protein